MGDADSRSFPARRYKRSIFWLPLGSSRKLVHKKVLVVDEDKRLLTNPFA